MVGSNSIYYIRLELNWLNFSIAYFFPWYLLPKLEEENRFFYKSKVYLNVQIENSNLNSTWTHPYVNGCYRAYVCWFIFLVKYHVLGFKWKENQPFEEKWEIMQQDIKPLLWTNNEYLLSFLHDKSQTAIVHTNLNIANKPGKPFLFTRSNNSLYQIYHA